MPISRMPRKLENVPSVPVDFVPVDLIRGLDAKAARVRFACLKDLVRLSRTTPEALYPSFDFFVQLLDSDNSIFQWNAARILANLAAVDRDSKLENVLQTSGSDPRQADDRRGGGDPIRSGHRGSCG